MKYGILKINIPAGDTDFQKEVSFPSGHNIVAVGFVQQTGDNDNQVQIEIEDSERSSIIKKMSIKWLSKSSDGFKTETFMAFPPGIRSNAGVFVDITTPAMTNDFTGELLFLLEKNAVMEPSGAIVPREEYDEKYCKINASEEKAL